MESVLERWRSATTLDAGSCAATITADQLKHAFDSTRGGAQQGPEFRLGKLLITSVSILDQGLKG
jgi:hypothetical protein